MTFLKDSKLQVVNARLKTFALRDKVLSVQSLGKNKIVTMEQPALKYSPTVHEL